MTLKVKQNGTFTDVGGGAADASGWVRPADWLTMPAASNSFVGLLAVWEYGFNSVALQCAGNYTVDWGDGTSENVNANTTAQHAYTYSALTGTDCTRGYRQAVVVVTPQSGQVLSKVDLNQRHTSATSKTASSPWLDIAVSSASLATLAFGYIPRFAGSAERITIGLHSLTSLASMFRQCISLRSLSLFDTSNIENWLHCFRGCSALTSVPLFDMSSATALTYSFNSCASLVSVPPFDTSAANSMSYMFGGCPSLTSVPLFDTSLVESMSNMFYGCSSLRSLPLFDASKVTVTTSSLDLCYSLQTGAMSGTKVSISYQDCDLSATELNRIYTNLATVTAKTITITGNPGVSGDDPTIATAKGWTVSG